MARDPDPPRAWLYLRCDPASRAKWRERAAPPEYEPGTPFPIRVQSEGDLAALVRWDLLAWQDPFEDGGPLSAFFAAVPMLDGADSASAPPLVPQLAEAGSRLEALRLADGVLVLKVEKEGMAVQARVTEPGPLLSGGGVRVWHEWGPRLPVNIAPLTDLWSVTGNPSPRSGIGGQGRKGTATSSS